MGYDALCFARRMGWGDLGTGSGKANWSNADAYEKYMGRWSRLTSKIFVNWLAVPVSSHWLDVGSGTGALSQAILDGSEPASIRGFDPAEAFVERAAKSVNDYRATFETYDGKTLPVQTGKYDAVVAGLVLNLFPDVDRGIAEMVRVTRSSGTVAAYVWDYGGKMEIMRRFWDVATTLDPEASKFDEGQREPSLCNPDALTEHFESAGLSDVKVDAIDVQAHFVDFDDYWLPFTGGQGFAPTYTASLDGKSRTDLKEQLRSVLSSAADGSIDLIARAWAVKGIR